MSPVFVKPRSHYVEELLKERRAVRANYEGKAEQEEDLERPKLSSIPSIPGGCILIPFIDSNAP